MIDQKKGVRATPNSEFVVDIARKVVVYINRNRYHIFRINTVTHFCVVI
jgi:hypothetical protein